MSKIATFTIRFFCLVGICAVLSGIIFICTGSVEKVAITSLPVGGIAGVLTKLLEDLTDGDN